MASFLILPGLSAWYGLIVWVVVVRFRVLENNVPSVQKTRDVAKTAKRYVDDGVGSADASFDPN